MSDERAEGRIDVAIKRLDRAVTLLDQRIARRVGEAQAHSGSMSDTDRARLAAELDAAHSRERALEEAGAEASAALANAIAELRAVLDQQKEG